MKIEEKSQAILSKKNNKRIKNRRGFFSFLIIAKKKKQRGERNYGLGSKKTRKSKAGLTTFPKPVYIFSEYP